MKIKSKLVGLIIANLVEDSLFTYGMFFGLCSIGKGDTVHPLAHLAVAVVDE